MLGVRWWKLGAALLLLTVVGCGDDDADTPYGDAEIVSAYRSEVGAIIGEVNDIEQVLRQMAVGSTGQATGQNLATACSELETRLAGVLEELDAVEPPRKLRAAHADMRTAVELRQRACTKIAAGWQVEQEQSFAAAEAIYDEAQDLLAQAGALLVAVNETLGEVDVALGGTGEGNPVG